MHETPPHNPEAEEGLLGACLLSSDAFEKVYRLLSPADFYHPSHGIVFSKMLEMHNKGEAIDVVTLSNELSNEGTLDKVGGAAHLLSIQSGTPAISNAVNYANIIIEMAAYRRAIEIASSLVEQCFQKAADPSDLIEQAVSALGSAGVRIGDVPSDLWVLDDFLARPDSERAQWCIPGLIRKGWRVVIVAAEGVGKTVLLRQLAIAASQGIHPLRHTPMEPCRTLIIDLENPEDSIMDVCNPITERAINLSTDYDPDRAWLWHRPSGMNFRRRQDRIALEAVINEVKPDLVCMGPLYKCYEVGARENDELAAKELMAVLDDLRTRYDFGLILEHHAPKASSGSKRVIMPYGTSLWLRWPEIGLALTPEGEGMETLTVGRWRGDRLDNDWPIKLHRSRTWPWQGEFGTSGGGGGAPVSPVNRPSPTKIEQPLSREEYIEKYSQDDDEDDGAFGFDEPF